MKFDETLMMQEEKERFTKSVSLRRQEGIESDTLVKGLVFVRTKKNYSQ